MTRSSPSRPVVVGVDGSDGARAATVFATDEARLRRTSLRLLHALSWPLKGLAAETSPDPDLRETLQAGVEVVLRATAADAADVLGADRVSWSVVDEDPVTALRTASADAQVLVVGSRGVGGILGLLGSTANGVVADAACPVVVLPDPTSVTATPRASVVVGVEGRPGDDAVLDFAFAEAAARGTDLVAVHAWQDVTLETAFQSLGPLVDWAGVQADEERVLAETLAGWRQKEPDVPVREVVLRERTARALVSVGLTAALLVVGHRHRKPLARLGSTTHGVLRRAGCPVAVVPITSDGAR
ncbi:universal stress protein [Geodermatophilus ruber]|uniref:Nucleotide-binding universal stress protein, UspA family n=1 Tax=Geodermatophilus ruber TaxID=504800 RepID=A0A1I4E1W0_9ACTN|nr:universal stress protein [Geodermatophilus ruber]SFK99814.1 Nucleotide-binding universal stress protein, UspA family [Geodermatophilus ruber]